jgi:hypothetical protein
MYFFACAQPGWHIVSCCYPCQTDIKLLKSLKVKITIKPINKAGDMRYYAVCAQHERVHTPV